MWNVRWPAVALAAWALSGLGCGEDNGNDDTTDDAAMGGAAGSGTGMQGLPAGSRIVASTTPPRAEECQSSGNCTGGNGTPACATVAGAYRLCTFQPPVVTAASTSTLDECDGDSPCAPDKGSCFSVQSFPTGQCGAGFQMRNMCRKDGCASDAECPGGVCGPRGFASENLVAGGAIRQCIKADCKSSADCTASPGGICAMVQPGCLRTTFYPAQLACVYSGGCTNNSNCPSSANSTCKVVNGTGVCLSQ